MFDFLHKNKRHPIALDVGNDSIKMLQIQLIGSVARVSACGRWRFPEVPAGDVQQRRDLALAAVRDMLKKGGFKGRKVISVLPSSVLAIKNVRLPHVGERELAQAVAWEAKERLEFEAKPDQMGFLNAGEVRQGAETRDEVIILAAPQQVVDDHLSMLDAMGLEPQHIDAEPIGLFRAFERHLRRKADEQTVTMLVDVGLGGTRVVVARGRQIVFLKTIDIGGRNLNEAVASHLNLSYTEAADLRMRLMRQEAEKDRVEETAPPGPAEPGDVRWTVHDAVRAQIELLAKEIALCLRYCSVTFRGLRCQNVTLTGGEAYDPALPQLLSEHLNLPCALGRPLRGIDTSGHDMGNRRGVLTEWAVCSGLALRGLDLQDASEEENGPHRLSA